ncbi:MAG: S24/S26 family peptidase [Acidobacteriaceae bacterium]|jgi:signal peptidase I
MVGQHPTQPDGELLDEAKHDLAVEVVRRFGEVRLKVNGASMLPSVWPGDIVTVRRRSAAELLPGSIVLCYRNRGLVAHRLIGRQGDRILTRGDSHLRDDPPFAGEEVLGEVVSILRNGRSVALTPAWWHRIFSWIMRHSDLSIRIVLRLRRSINLSWAG